MEYDTGLIMDNLMVFEKPTVFKTARDERPEPPENFDDEESETFARHFDDFCETCEAFMEEHKFVEVTTKYCTALSVDDIIEAVSEIVWQQLKKHKPDMRQNRNWSF